jgi:hypothetical protein
MAAPKASKFAKALALGYRSGLEVAVSKFLDERGIPYEYEQHTLPYTQEHTYTPDFYLPKKTGGFMIVETKGYFASGDRGKMRRIKAQHPGLDIRFVFSKPQNRLGKRSTTTYAMWAEQHGFPWAAVKIPEEWLAEVAS